MPFMQGATTVGTVVAEDADENDVIGSWQIKGGTGVGIFEIDAGTGDIRIAQPQRIDFTREAYQLTVMAGDGRLPSHEAEVIVKIPSDVQICHKGRSQHVNKRAVPAHLAPSDMVEIDTIIARHRCFDRAAG